MKLRKLHRIATLVVGAQIVIWTATGFAFSWFDFARVRGVDDREPPTALVAEEARLTPADAIARARTVSASAAVTSVELRPLLGHPVFAVSFAGGAQAIVDARDGAVRGELTAEDAGAVARAEFKGRPVVAGVERVSKASDAPDLALPVYRVRMADARGTEVYVAPGTGKVLAWRNAHWRWFDRLWSLHVLGYINRDSPAHVGLRVLGGLALLVSLTGVALLVSTVGRRRREART